MVPTGTYNPTQAPMSAPATLLELPTRLSDSLIWKLQSQFYLAAGTGAFITDEAVPSFITSCVPSTCHSSLAMRDGLQSVMQKCIHCTNVCQVHPWLHP